MFPLSLNLWASVLTQGIPSEVYILFLGLNIWGLQDPVS